jgi:catechol 2,3-dioxygenase-like lactoylglutathione lyase family enzyme
MQLCNAVERAIRMKSFISWLRVDTNDAIMEIYRISAVTLKVRNMGESCAFYSKLPGFTLAYGGPKTSFTTFEVGRGTKMYLNLELQDDTARHVSTDPDMPTKSFGRIIFHTDDVDGLYRFMTTESGISHAAIFENAPKDASWGERFFHVSEPDGYQLSFAQPITKETEKYYCE